MPTYFNSNFPIANSVELLIDYIVPTRNRGFKPVHLYFSRYTHPPPPPPQPRTRRFAIHVVLELFFALVSESDFDTATSIIEIATKIFETAGHPSYPFTM